MHPRLCLFGAAPGTANLGVEALGRATVAGVRSRLPQASVTVFDFGRGTRVRELPTAGGAIEQRLVGANHSRRLWRRDTLATMRALGRLPLPRAFRGDGLNAVRDADAVLDLSGGDSFSDLYGRRVYETVALPKRIALDAGRPLVLLPQTYGPFADDAVREDAAELVRAAESAWARDARSFAVLRELVGDAFDPERHRLGVDVAFGLPARRRPGGVDATVEAWLADDPAAVVGVNVSGLVWHDPAGLGFRADYRALVHGLLDGLLEREGVRVVLVPHVLVPPGGRESDLAACRAAAGGRDRVRVLEPPFDECEVKDVVARTDWFCGTRMHATIAALSSGVPAAAVAYSPKFLGVFERCDQADGVADPTLAGTEECVDALLAAYDARELARARLAAALDGVRATLDAQLDDVVDVCLRGARRRRSA